MIDSQIPNFDNSDINPVTLESIRQSKDNKTEIVILVSTFGLIIGFVLGTVITTLMF